MPTNPVHWYEGMFLRPQHFQASDRYWQATMSLSMRWQNNFAYGIHSIRIEKDSLGAGFFQLAGCEVILRDGTIVDLAGRDLRIPLSEAFKSQAVVDVYLGVSKLVLGRANSGAEGDPTIRSSAFSTPTADENTGGSETELDFKHLNFKLLLSTDNLDGYEAVPLARVVRGAGEEAQPEIAPDYFPPLLAVQAWEDLSIGVLRSIYDLIGQKVDVLSQRTSNRKLTFASNEQGDLEDLLMLDKLNESLAAMHALTFTQQLHPYWAYVELCRIVGMLSVFAEGRRLDPQLPAYDHDNLAYVFLWLKRKISELIGSSKKLEYEQRFFVGVERGMQVTLDPKWLHDSWKWYIGVHGENIPEAICRELVRPGVLDWKMGSNQQVDLLFKHRMPDVKSDDQLTNPPRALPSKRGWIYFQVEKQTPAWKDVLADQSLGMRFNTNVIANLDRLVGQRKLEVVFRQKRAILEFALFAVPTGP